MSTEAIRNRFEKGFKATEDGWVLDPAYSSFSFVGNKYIPVKSGGFHVVSLLNKAFEGYMQAVKDMEAEVDRLEKLLEIAVAAIDFSTAHTKVVGELGEIWKEKYQNSKHPCLWDSLSDEDKLKPMGLSCNCPKCSPYSMVQS